MADLITSMFRRIRLYNAAKQLDPYADWENVPMKELCPIGTLLNERQHQAVEQAKFLEMLPCKD